MLRNAKTARLAGATLRRKGVFPGLVVALLLAAVPVLATITPGNPHLLNLTVYFDYDEADPSSWEPVFVAASELLYNATEKQMQLGNVSVFNRCPAIQDTADVIVSSTTDGASAHMFGFGREGRHMFISQTHKSTTGFARGQFGIVHEIGHYVFGLHDEYLGRSTTGRLPMGIPMGAAVNGFYCAIPVGSSGPWAGGASIMDGGTTVPFQNRRTEFCTDAEHGFSTSHHTGYYTSKWSDSGAEHGNIIRNRQELREGESAWSTLVRELKNRHGITLQEPTSEPRDDITGHQPITFDVRDCAGSRGRSVVYVLDRSGSMAGTPLALAKTGTKLAVSLLSASTSVGVVSFSDSARVDFALRELRGNRDRVREVIDSLVSDGGTDIGAGLQEALTMLTGASQRSGNEVIVLLTDGRGSLPDSVVQDIVNARIRVNTIGLGTGVDSVLLSNVARKTGGTAALVTRVAQLAGVLVRQNLVAEGHDIIARNVGELAVGEAVTETVTVTAHSSELSFGMSWDRGDVAMEVRDPSGVRIRDGSGVRTSSTGTSHFAEIDNPAVGEWTVKLTADAGNADVANYELQAVEVSSGVLFDTSSSSDNVTFPSPVKLEASMAIDGKVPLGSKVQATVKRPDGTEFVVALHDDGLAAHGDEFANDGVYAAWFSQYGGNGVYEANIDFDTTGAVTGQATERDPNFVPVPIAELRRLDSVTFNVRGVPNRLPEGGLALGEGVMLQDQVAPPSVVEHTMLSFWLAADRDEAVNVTSIAARGSGTGDDSRVESVNLYVDTDADGEIDATGVGAEPLVSGTFDQDDGSIIFDSPLRLDAGRTVQLLVSYKFSAM